MVNSTNETGKSEGKSDPDNMANNLGRDETGMPKANINGHVLDDPQDGATNDNTPTPSVDSTKLLNPFDPEGLRLSGSDDLVVSKQLTIVRCVKPNRHSFVRTHPRDEYRLETALFEDQLEGDMYLVDPSLWGALAKDIKPTCLFTTMDRQGDLILWPVKLPGQGRPNTWNESALAAARIAKDKWVRVSANMNAGMYDVNVAQGEIPDPVWPDIPLRELLKLCFQNRLIDSIDHPVLKRLRGEL